MKNATCASRARERIQILLVLWGLVFLPFRGTAQQNVGELSGSIALTSNQQKALSVVTVDLSANGKIDEVVDGVFVIIGAAPALDAPPGEGRIRSPAITLLQAEPFIRVEQDNPFIEVTLTSGRSFFRR